MRESLKACLKREPLAVLLHFILPRGVQEAASSRRLLRHCGAPLCAARECRECVPEAKGAGDDETALRAQGDAAKEEARIAFLCWLDVCPCSALARVLIRVKTLDLNPWMEARLDFRFESVH